MFSTKPSFSYDQFTNDLPMLHTWDGGATWNTGGFGKEHFEQFRDVFSKLPKHPVFLETGAGCSTIAMLLSNPRKVISIAPDKSLFDRIRAYCRRRRISLRPLEAHVEGSEWVLPKMAMRHRVPFLDFALIDGRHAWPLPFVDLQYAETMLKRGGFLAIDDVQLHSVKEIARFLDAQPGFPLLANLGKTRIYQKTGEPLSSGEWNTQPYILSRTDDYSRWPDPFASACPAHAE